MKSKTSDREVLRKKLRPLVEELTLLIAERLSGIPASGEIPSRASAATTPKPKPRARQVAPVLIVGGIDPTKSYAVHEFLAIARISRQKFSIMRRVQDGLTVRDAAGVPFVLGKDWLDYLARAPKHVARQRRTVGNNFRRSEDSLSDSNNASE